MASQQILCCGARTWTLVIGWIQTISSAILLGAMLLAFVIMIFHNHSESKFIAKDDDKDEEGEAHQSFIRVLLYFLDVFLIVIFMTGLITGVMLILSVKQENARKLKIWIIIQLVLLAVPIVLIVSTAFLSLGYGEIVSEMIVWVVVIALNGLSIWIVNIHRKEVLSVGESRVRYVSRI